MSDYFLNKIYSSILKNKTKKEPVFKTLSESYISIYEQESAQPDSSPEQTNLQQNVPSKPEQPAIVKKSEPPQGRTMSEYIDYLLGGHQEPSIDYSKYFTSSPKSFNVQSQDMQIFRKLFEERPPTKLDEPQSAGSGKGELALFWLLKSHGIQDTRGRGNPDLTLNNIGIEVKTSDSKVIKVGKIRDDIENRRILATVFGVEALFNTMTGAKERVLSPDNWNTEELARAFLKFEKLYNAKLNEIQNEFIQSLYQKLQEVIDYLGKDVQDYTSSLIKKIITSKLKIKPKDGGFFANITKEGKITLHQVNIGDIENLTTDKFYSGDKDRVKIIRPQISVSASEVIVPTRFLTLL
jgi:hypothetical protein